MAVRKNRKAADMERRRIDFHSLMLHCKQINEDCLHCDRIEDCNDCLRVIGKVTPANGAREYRSSSRYRAMTKTMAMTCRDR